MGKLSVQKKAWGDDDKEQAITTILDAIKQDPIIESSSNISVTFDDAEKKELHVIGKVTGPGSKSRLREILEQNTPSDVEIHDETVVG
ncbi:MAG: hypothetical protein EA383_16675 [Spirochaetaceae bacterium]|nr:MAG: hypothetical protein EA383_16675 [Spirochaetaceae bacterium]